MEHSDLDSILDELAAGRIDRAEAARQIDEVRARGDHPQRLEPDSPLPDAGDQDSSVEGNALGDGSAAGLGWPSHSGAEATPRRAAQEPSTDPASPPEGVDRTESTDAAAAEEVAHADLGRAQSPGVAREDFRVPVHGSEESAEDDNPGTDAPDNHASSDTDTEDSPTDPGQPGREGAGETEPLADLGRSWLASAREGFGKLRAEAEQGFDRLRAEAEARVAERRADGGGEAASTARRTAKTGGVERVLIRVVGRRVRIVGDAKVTTVTVDGPHNLRRRDRVIEVTSEGEVGPSMQGFSIFRPPRSFDDVKSMGLGKEMTIKVNPELIVDAEVTGGSLHTENVARLGKIRVTVGGARFVDVAEAEDVLVQAGPATLSGTIDSGLSRVRCESGSLTVSLGPESNVTVRAEAQLGRIGWAGGHSGAADEVVLGNGSARLDVGVVMGSATIRTERLEADSDDS